MYSTIKRIIDTIIASVMIIVLSPIFLIVAIAVKLDSKGPAIFKQDRIGKNFKPFKMYKFRSMIVNAQNMGTGVYAFAGDPRITRVGRIIRKTSLDELPQLWNIIKGDMAFVGSKNREMTAGYRLYKGAWIFEKDPHKEKRLTLEEVKVLFSDGGLMIRNAYDFDCGQETSFWYVIKDSFGGMEELSSKMRNQVKKCFKTMRVASITADELKEQGYPVFVEAANSYKVESVPPSKEEFEARINNAEENEFWGCFDIESNVTVR